MNLWSLKNATVFLHQKKKNFKHIFLSAVCLHFFRRSPETRKRALKEICDRARSTDNLLPQLFLCPEGTNTNRKALIQFKVGAFAPGVPVQPVLIKYPGTERVGKYIIGFRNNFHIDTRNLSPSYRCRDMDLQPKLQLRLLSLVFACQSNKSCRSWIFASVQSFRRGEK